ncbi:DoxX family protein [Luteococcus sp.]|uniref:DoxX family protein n=1 Tax=Luteococcus sp. TaxID=1969402 RepID=UPI003735DE27
MTDLTPDPHRPFGAKDWIGLLARLVLGGALVYAASTKITNLDGSVLSVRAYQFPFLSYSMEKTIGYALPVFEMVLGVLILVGLFTRIAGAVGLLTMLVFIAGIASAWARGLSIDCGCFSQGGQTDDPKYLTEIIRDTGFALAGLWLAVRPRTPFSVDNWLFRPIPAPGFHDSEFDDHHDADEDALVGEDTPR